MLLLPRHLMVHKRGGAARLNPYVMDLRTGTSGAILGMSV